MDEHVGGVQVSSHIVRPRPHEKSLALPRDGEWQVRVGAPTRSRMALDGDAIRHASRRSARPLYCTNRPT